MYFTDPDLSVFDWCAIPPVAVGRFPKREGQVATAQPASSPSVGLLRFRSGEPKAKKEIKNRKNEKARETPSLTTYRLYPLHHFPVLFINTLIFHSPTKKMPARNLPHYHNRRHSWPPFSTRNLLSVAPVHFHLLPANPKKRTATSPPPSAASSSMLPDIDDDPFAHFLSPMNEEDHPYDNLAFSAGIIIADAGDEESDRKDRLKHKLARRWAKYVAKYHHGAGSSRNAASLERVIEEDSDTGSEDDEGRRNSAEGMSIDEGYMSEETATPVHFRKPQRPGPEPLASYQTVVREPTRGRAQDLVDGRMRKKRKFRHSWRAPDQDLFTVVEEGEGVVDSEIEQRYFSA